MASSDVQLVVWFRTGRVISPFHNADIQALVTPWERDRYFIGRS